MKKHLIAVIALSLLLAGCSSSTSEAGTESTANDGQVTQADVQTQQAPPPVIEITRKDRAYLTLDTDENIISAEVVVFDSDSSDKLEQLQTDAIKQYIEKLTDKHFELSRLEKDETKQKDFSVMSIDLDAELKFTDESTISLVYTGTLTSKDAADPMQLFYSLNLDAKSLEPILFSESYIIGEDLYQVFADNSAAAMTAKWGEGYAEEIGSFSDAVCDAASFKAGIEDGSIVHYYTDTKVGLSFPLPSALGGHIEIEVPYVQLDLLKYASDTTGTNVLMREGLYKVYYEVFPETPNEADYFISAITNDSTLVSVYMGTYTIRDVSAGAILVADTDSDHREEIVVNINTSQEGESLTRIYRFESNMLELVTELTVQKNISCEYQNGKKVKLTSEDGSFKYEADISTLFDNSAFDKNGKAIGDGILGIKPIRDIKLNGQKVECVATITLDTIDAFDITYSLRVKDGVYMLTPVSAAPTV